MTRSGTQNRISFKPERFINPDGSAREDPVFGVVYNIWTWKMGLSRETLG
jgi:hypothetical protein